MFESRSNPLDDSRNEARTHQSIEIADDDDIAAREGDSGVVHEMLVVIDIGRHLQRGPDIDPIVIRPKAFEDPIVEFEIDHLDIIRIDRLITQIMDNMRTFPDAPIEQDEADPGFEGGAGA